MLRPRQPRSAVTDRLRRAGARHHSPSSRHGGARHSVRAVQETSEPASTIRASRLPASAGPPPGLAHLRAEANLRSDPLSINSAGDTCLRGPFWESETEEAAAHYIWYSPPAAETLHIGPFPAFLAEGASDRNGWARPWVWGRGCQWDRGRRPIRLNVDTNCTNDHESVCIRELEHIHNKFHPYGWKPGFHFVEGRLPLLLYVRIACGMLDVRSLSPNSPAPGCCTLTPAQGADAPPGPRFLPLTALRRTLPAHANGSWRSECGASGWLAGGVRAGHGRFLWLVLAEKAAQGEAEGAATPAGEVVAASRVFGHVPNGRAV